MPPLRSCAGGCETFLAKSPEWSATIRDIPETPDEARDREDYEKRGSKERNQVMALALAKLTGVELPEALMRPADLLALQAPAVAGSLVCGNGHDCPAGSRFCGQCGDSLHAPVAAGAIGSAPAAGAEAARPLKSMRADELKALAPRAGPG